MHDELRGLGGRWFNGWLAALGITVLLEGARLAWTDDPSPVAIVTTPGDISIAEEVAHALPEPAHLAELSISGLSRNVSIDAYRAAAERERSTRDFALGATLTDLAPSKKAGEIVHSPLDPPAPRGETIHQRLIRCRTAVPEGDAEFVARALRGVGARIKANGLGFDFSRISSDPGGDKYVDPVIECLAFFGLWFVPLRGDGHVASARGWNANDFSRPTWRPALDRWGIDALLGQVFSRVKTRGGLERLGVTQRFRAIYYRGTGDMDQTRAIASTRDKR